jgi:ABC-2 type transport system ATP-binding protein
MPDASAVALRGVRKRFSRVGRWVLNGVDLTAGAGTVNVIAGNNGSGKSTLLRIVAGAAGPTEGQVERPPRSVAYVPEELPARLRMDADTYIGHLGRLRGLDRAVVAERSRSLFDRLGLDPGPHVPIGDLSKGNSQKVALTQAFLAPTQLLVLDEPYSGLDEEAGKELVGLLEEARGAGSTIVLSTHDPAVLAAADAAYFLVDGQLRPAPSWPELSAVERPRTVIRLVLTAVDDRASPQELASMPGVAAADYDLPGGQLVVRTEDADSLLYRALASGWSFQRGHPEDGQS